MRKVRINPFVQITQFYSIYSYNNVITCVKKHAARYGIPKCIVSDCGTQFTSREFAQFVQSWKIKHITSAPGHQQANGKAESAVKLIKQVLKKAVADNTDQYLALLELRNTPRQNTNCSPAQLMFNRATRSIIPTAPQRSCKPSYNETSPAKSETVLQQISQGSSPFKKWSADLLSAS